MGFFGTFVTLFLHSLFWLGIDYLLLVIVLGISKGWIAGFIAINAIYAACTPPGEKWHGLVFLAPFIAYIWVLP